MRNDAAAELLALASAVARLRPDWRNGEAFYEARSEIIAALRRLARTLVLPPPGRRRHDLPLFRCARHHRGAS